MHRVRGGVLTRRVYDDFALEQASAEGVIEECLDAGAVERLYACGACRRVSTGANWGGCCFGLLPSGNRLRGASSWCCRTAHA